MSSGPDRVGLAPPPAAFLPRPAGEVASTASRRGCSGAFNAPSASSADSSSAGRGSKALSAVETGLSDWFGAEVILTSSGRAALRLAFDALGPNRYRDRIAVPPLISACVMEAVIRHGFPVEPGQAAAAEVLYPQYGIPSLRRPDGPVVEDICHGFFAGPDTGARDWAGHLAVFSLPKAVSTAGMAGGLVVLDSSLAGRLRAMRDDAPEPIDDRSVWQADAHNGGPALEQVYLRRLLNPRVAPEDLAGLPTDLSGWRVIGAARASVTARLLDAIPDAWLPNGWRALIAGALPFGLPLFGPPARLADDLAALGVAAATYRIDRARNAAAPDLAPALLLPCHHAIPDDTLDAMVAVLEAAR